MQFGELLRDALEFRELLRELPSHSESVFHPAWKWKSTSPICCCQIPDLHYINCFRINCKWTTYALHYTNYSRTNFAVITVCAVQIPVFSLYTWHPCQTPEGSFSYHGVRHSPGFDEKKLVGNRLGVRGQMMERKMHLPQRFSPPHRQDTLHGTNQRKTKGQQLKGKIVSALFTLFGTFPHIFTLLRVFQEFSSRTFS